MTNGTSKKIIPTDYSDMNNWLLNEYGKKEKSDSKVDLIYFYGTATAKADTWNGVSTLSEADKKSALSMSKIALDVISRDARIYVPYYRQVSLMTALKGKTHNDLIEGVKNNEPGADICAALDYYFEHYNNGRPFILSGTSQGGASVQVALDMYFGQKKNRAKLDNMVVAYSFAYGVDKKWLNQIGYLKPAKGEFDTGVVASWNVEGPGEKGYNILLADNCSDTLVINPINWKTDNTYAKGSECPYSYSMDPDYRYSEPGEFNLQLDPERGSLICDNCTDYITLEGEECFWGGKSLHSAELYFPAGSIAKNIVDRTEAFLKKDQL